MSVHKHSHPHVKYKSLHGSNSHTQIVFVDHTNHVINSKIVTEVI